MAKITIGDRDYIVPEMNFAAVELAWPAIDQATRAFDPMTGTSSALAVIAAGLMEAPEFNRADFGIKDEEVLEDKEIHERVTRFLKKACKASQLGDIKEGMFKILEEAGLEVEEGELMGALVEALGVTLPNPSQETAPATSPSSAPQTSVVETGTLSESDTVSESITP